MSDAKRSALRLHNTDVYYLEELRENFYLEDILKLYQARSLQAWLRSCGYQTQLEQIEALDKEWQERYSQEGAQDALQAAAAAASSVALATAQEAAAKDAQSHVAEISGAATDSAASSSHGSASGAGGSEGTVDHDSVDGTVSTGGTGGTSGNGGAIPAGTGGDVSADGAGADANSNGTESTGGGAGTSASASASKLDVHAATTVQPAASQDNGVAAVSTTTAITASTTADALGAGAVSASASGAASGTVGAGMASGAAHAAETNAAQSHTMFIVKRLLEIFEIDLGDCDFDLLIKTLEFVPQEPHVLSKEDCLDSMLDGPKYQENKEAAYKNFKEACILVLSELNNPQPKEEFEQIFTYFPTMAKHHATVMFQTLLRAPGMGLAYAMGYPEFWQAIGLTGEPSCYIKLLTEDEENGLRMLQEQMVSDFIAYAKERNLYLEETCDSFYRLYTIVPQDTKCLVWLDMDSEQDVIDIYSAAGNKVICHHNRLFLTDGLSYRTSAYVKLFYVPV